MIPCFSDFSVGAYLTYAVLSIASGKPISAAVFRIDPLFDRVGETLNDAYSQVFGSS